MDSSVILGMLDPEDAHHAAATAVLTRYTEDGVPFGLPASVLSEVLVGDARQGETAVAHRREQLVALFGAVRHVDEEVAIRAAELRAKHRSLRLPDALVIAVGLVDDAAAIVTADKRWAAVDSRVQVLA